MTTDPIQIIGAGPVGLLLACLLGRRGLEVEVYEKRVELPRCFHHLPDDVIPPLLADAHRLCRRGFVISDLLRSPWSYLGFSLVAHIYRDSFARADGLISIRKGFRPSDFKDIAAPLHIRTALPGRIQLLGGCFDLEQHKTRPDGSVYSTLPVAESLS